MNKKAPSSDATPEILIVEDSTLEAELLRRCLSGAGYRVTVATDGEQGLQAISRKPSEERRSEHVEYEGDRHTITDCSQHILNLLLSVYENSMSLSHSQAGQAGAKQGFMRRTRSKTGALQKYRHVRPGRCHKIGQVLLYFSAFSAPPREKVLSLNLFTT